jgi:phytoene dehydrogenase-like protein
MRWSRHGCAVRAAGRQRAAGRSGVEIETAGDRARGVRTQSGWRQDFDAVASNADIMHSYRDLLGGSARGRKVAGALDRKRFSPSLFLVHFGVRGSWPGIPHHMILFGPRYEGLLTDIYKNGVLPEDFSLYLHHPTVTDPSWRPRDARPSMRSRRCRISANCRSTGRVCRRGMPIASSTRSSAG